MPDRRSLPVLAALFAVTGASALVYQVVWQRILALHTGVGVWSVAIIVSSFMVGLGLGSHLGGLLSRRLGRPGALVAFALAEAGVGLFALASTWLYYDLLYVRGSGLYAAPWRAGLLHLAALLPPTTLMGLSLPLLARALVRDGPSAARTLGWLYGLNVTGAALGAWLAPWVLMRHLGLRGAVLVGAAGNLAAALGALTLRRFAPAGAAPAATAVTLPPPLDRGGLPGWLGLYALSGFCALGLEVLWFRLLDVAVKSTAFTFGTVLGTYLLGCGAGALAGAWRAPRVERPLRAFLLCQCALLAFSALAVIALVDLPAATPGLSWWLEYWGRNEGLRLGQGFPAGLFLRLYVALPLALFGLPTLLMGFSFPLLQRAVQDDPRSAGFKAGALQAANILGCVAGSLATVGALERLGTAGALRGYVGVGLVFAALGLWRERASVTPWLLSATLLAACVAALPGQGPLWRRLHGLSAQAGQSALLAEDSTGLVALVRHGETWDLFLSGAWNSRLPFGGIHARLGALAALLHPAPEEILVIGLGSGNTAWAAGCRPETRSLHVHEIRWPQLGLLRSLAATPDPPAGLRAFLGDPRFEVRYADGRQALLHQGRRYDVIEIDALRPDESMSGNLYSREFFELAAARLKPGGLLCLWAPTPRARATFRSVFAHVLQLGREDFLAGSLAPMDLAAVDGLQRLRRAEVAAYLGPQVVDAVALLLAATRPAEAPAASAEGLNHDLFPRDELASPR